MIDLDELDRLAKAATPGEWRATTCGSAGERFLGLTEDDACSIESADGLTVATDGASDECHHIFRSADANFIAAANPSAVLELVAEVRRLRAGIDDVFFKLRHDAYDQAREIAEGAGEKYEGGAYEDLKALRAPWAR